MEKQTRKNDAEITISGIMAGRMWWPSDRQEFDFSKTLTYKPRQQYIFSDQTTDLRDALLKCQDSGDFQSLSFVEPVEVTVIHKLDTFDPQTGRILETRKRYRSFEVSPDHPDYKDLFE